MLLTFVVLYIVASIAIGLFAGRVKAQAGRAVPSVTAGGTLC